MSETINKLMITILAIIAINQGVATFFNFNILTSIVPDYTKYVLGAGALLGAYLLYNMFKKK